jgi:hypothetical protein
VGVVLSGVGKAGNGWWGGGRSAVTLDPRATPAEGKAAPSELDDVSLGGQGQSEAGAGGAAEPRHDRNFRLIAGWILRSGLLASEDRKRIGDILGWGNSALAACLPWPCSDVDDSWACTQVEPLRLEHPAARPPPRQAVLPA